MSAGTAGFIVFDDLVHGIKAIKAGFDSDFQPVFLIATHEAEIPFYLNKMPRFSKLKFDTFRVIDDQSAVNEHPFWNTSLTHLNSIESGKAITIEKGIYAFKVNYLWQHQTWSLKPHEKQPWHILLEFAQRSQNGLSFWQLTMEKREDITRDEELTTTSL